MASFLRPDTPFYRAWSAAADLVVVNVLTLAGCLPVLTAGAALTACARVAMDMAREEDRGAARTWWCSFRGNLRQSLAWWPPILLLLATAAWEWRVLGSAGQAGPAATGAVSGLLLAGLVVVAGVLTWLLPLQAGFENTAGRHLANAARLALGRLDLTAVCLVIAAAPAAVVWLLPGARAAAAWFMALIGPAFAAYLMALVQRRVIAGLSGQHRERPGDGDEWEPPSGGRPTGSAGDEGA